MLRDRDPGSFVVRDSRCYPGAFGLALKVDKVPQAILATAKPGGKKEYFSILLTSYLYCFRRS